MSQSSSAAQARDQIAPKGSDAFRAAMSKAAIEVEGILEQILPQPGGPHRRIHEAMRYAVFAGGKRLRPFLVLNCAALFDVDRASAVRVATAIE